MKYLNIVPLPHITKIPLFMQSQENDHLNAHYARMGTLFSKMDQHVQHWKEQFSSTPVLRSRSMANDLNIPSKSQTIRNPFMKRDGDSLKAVNLPPEEDSTTEGFMEAPEQAQPQPFSDNVMPKLDSRSREHGVSTVPNEKWVQLLSPVSDPSLRKVLQLLMDTSTNQTAVITDLQTSSKVIAKELIAAKSEVKQLNTALSAQREFSKRQGKLLDVFETEKKARDIQIVELLKRVDIMERLFCKSDGSNQPAHVATIVTPNSNNTTAPLTNRVATSAQVDALASALEILNTRLSAAAETGVQRVAADISSIKDERDAMDSRLALLEAKQIDDRKHIEISIQAAVANAMNNMVHTRIGEVKQGPRTEEEDLPPTYRHASKTGTPEKSNRRSARDELHAQERASMELERAAQRASTMEKLHARAAERERLQREFEAEVRDHERCRREKQEEIARRFHDAQAQYDQMITDDRLRKHYEAHHGAVQLTRTPGRNQGDLVQAHHQQLLSESKSNLTAMQNVSKSPFSPTKTTQEARHEPNNRAGARESVVDKNLSTTNFTAHPSTTVAVSVNTTKSPAVPIAISSTPHTASTTTTGTACAVSVSPAPSASTVPISETAINVLDILEANLGLQSAKTEERRHPMLEDKTPRGNTGKDSSEESSKSDDSSASSLSDTRSERSTSSDSDGGLELPCESRSTRASQGVVAQDSSDSEEESYLPMAAGSHARGGMPKRTGPPMTALSPSPDPHALTVSPTAAGLSAGVRRAVQRRAAPLLVNLAPTAQMSEPSPSVTTSGGVVKPASHEGDECTDAPPPKDVPHSLVSSSRKVLMKKFGNNFDSDSD